MGLGGNVDVQRQASEIAAQLRQQPNYQHNTDLQDMAALFANIALDPNADWDDYNGAYATLVEVMMASRCAAP